MTKFEENLRHAFLDSRSELLMEKRKTDEKYKNLKKKYDNLFDFIKNQLDYKDRKLMSDLEALGNQKGSMDNEMIYLQGMIDCVKMLRIIRII
jgi:predicted nuclease with TOPRIM domain